MRKIEKEMLKALKENREFTKSNTCVLINRNGKFVTLWGNFIYGEKNDHKYFSDCGWETATTQSRLNALGAGYSRNKKHNKCKLHTGLQISNMYYWGTISHK